MPEPSFWSRLRQARLFQLLAIYAGASWVILQVTSLFIGNLGLPQWAMPAAIILLLIGLVVLCATAWVQSHPLTPHRAAAGDVPRGRAVALGEMKESLAEGRFPHLTWGRAILGGAFAFALLFGVAGLYVVIQDRGRSFTPEEALAEDAAPGIAVVPFSVRGAGLDVWREGMVDLLSTGLDGAAGLRAIDSRTVLARWGERVPGDTAADLATTLAVARETGARYAVVGSAVAIGPSVRLVADVYDAGSEKSLGQGTVEGHPDSVLQLVDRLAIEVLRVILQEGGGELPRVDLASITTASYPALKAYLEGEVLFRRAEFDEAITAYDRAIAADSTFALAYYRLGLAYGWTQSIASERQHEAVERALALTDRLPEREAVLVRSLWALINFASDGLKPLQEAVRKYPDDAEAWYLLGDTYYHMRTEVFATSADAEQAFTRSVELDPRFAPYQIHLINMAFSVHADSARASRWIASYGRLAPTSEHLQRGRLAHALSFGTPQAKARARAVLDTMEWSLAAGMLESLQHPDLWPQRRAVILAGLPRLDDAGRRRNFGRLAWGSLALRGRMREALGYLDDPAASLGDETAILYVAHSLGYPVEPDRLAERFSATAIDSTSGWWTFYVGAMAIDRDDAAVETRALTLIRAARQKQLAEGDSTGAREVEGALLALDGYGLWKRGQPAAALPRLEAARLLTDDDIVHWWLGELLLELDRPREAKRYFDSLWSAPLVRYYQGVTYEKLGEYEEARAAYEDFATYWKGADPELQPFVERGRQGVIRLTRLDRE